MNRYKPRGWRGESHRHYLAAKGISTTRKYNVTATTGAGKLLERGFQASDDRRARVVRQGSLPVRQQLAAQRSRIKSPLTEFEEQERQQVLQSLGSGRNLTELELAEFWTKEIGSEEFEDANADFVIASNRAKKARSDNNNVAKDATEEERAALAKELLDASNAERIAKQKRDEAAEVLNNFDKLAGGSLSPSVGLRIRRAMGRQVKRYQQQKEREENA